MKPIKPGKIIVLNGASSSGKSSLTKELQSQLYEPFMHVGVDSLIAMMPEKINDWTGKTAQDGFFWQKTQDADGQPLAHLRVGAFAQQVCDFLPEMVVNMAKRGFNVIVDHVIFAPEDFAMWQDKLKRFNVLYVGVIASDEELRQREKKRGDRILGSAVIGNRQVHVGKTYDLTVNSELMPLEDCAREIIQVFSNKFN